jgi:hypothetical protein
MTSFPDPVKSTALVVYNPQAHPLAKAKAHMQEMQDLFMEKSFKTQVADYQHFHRSWNGNVVVLAGGSSAGKSSIINALKTLDSGMVEEGSDLTGANSIYEFMEASLARVGVTSEDWQHLHEVLKPRPNNWHIHEAVNKKLGAGRSTYGFKSGTSVEDQDRAIATAAKLHEPVDEFAQRTSQMTDDIILKKVLEHAKSGRNVAFDMHEMDKIADHPLSQHAHIKSVFVYCPFRELTDRLAERNRKALAGEIDPSEVRAGVFPLLQYAELVRPVSDYSEDVIETISLGEVIIKFNKTFDAGIKVLESTPEGLLELDRMKTAEGGLEARRAQKEQILLTAFGCMTSDDPAKSIHLVPRRQYDLLIDTSDPMLGMTPAERANTAASRILRGA